MSNTIAVYTPFNSSSQILVLPNDLKFRVYYLEAPLSFLGEQVGINFVDDLLSINGYHTGIGFQSTDKSRPYELTFDDIVASGFTFNSLLPEVVTNSDGTRDLIWHNQPEITLGNFIDKIYWERSTYVCTVTSSQLIQIQNWILTTWIPRNPIYSLLSGIRSTSEEDIFNPVFRPSICDTFCYSMLNYIGSMDGGDQVDPVNTGTGLNTCIEYVTVPNVSVNTFVESTGTTFQPVDFEPNREDIINFYVAFEAEINEIINIEETIQSLIEQLEAAPPDQRPALIRQIINELFTLIQVIRTVYSSFDVAYYYGYGVGDLIDTPQYWRIDNPELTALYLNSNLKNSYRAFTNTGQTVIDNYSLDLNCECNCRPETVTRIVSSDDDFNTITWIVIAIIAFIFFILIIYFIIAAFSSP